jgi:nucleoid-associated protein YgaU
MVVGLVLVVAAAAGVGLGFAVALPGWLPGPPAAPGPAQPSYVIDPQASPSATRRSALPAAPSPVPAEYTVAAGDTLRSIADTVYGDANLWPTLYDANRDTIGPDPDALRVGMRLRLPSR